jgi:hypothetical protein
MRMWMFRIRIQNPAAAYQAGPDGTGREHEDPVVGRNGAPRRVDVCQAQGSGSRVVPYIKGTVSRDGFGF